MSEEEEVSDEDRVSDEFEEPHPQAKKKGGRKHKKMNVYDKTFLERLTDFARHYAASGDTNIHRDYTTAEGNNLGNWLREQRKKYNSGKVLDE
jgi:hypothetical protein